MDSVCPDHSYPYCPDRSYPYCRGPIAMGRQFYPGVANINFIESVVLWSDLVCIDPTDDLSVAKHRLYQNTIMFIYLYFFPISTR